MKLDDVGIVVPMLLVEQTDQFLSNAFDQCRKDTQARRHGINIVRNVCDKNLRVVSKVTTLERSVSWTIHT